MKMLLLYFGGSFLLHLLWENAQMPLFEGYGSFTEHFWICLVATATGDMIFMAVIYLSLALAHNNVLWVSDPKSYRYHATWVLPVIVGTLLAVSYELWAVMHKAHWYEYGSMPIIPIVEVGLTPVLQMIVVPLVTLLLCRWLLKRQETAKKDI